jgi:ubiquinone/menaquinone biosynthesis C-methylase UbiE
MKSHSWLWIVLGVAGGLLFLVTVVLKIVSRMADRLGYAMPCPVSLVWLVDNPLRQRYMRPVLAWVGIQPGETVLELGPGPGVFTVPAAQRVGPQGRLVAVDIQPQMIAQTEQRVRSAGLTNVDTHVASAYDLPLANESVDRAFLVSVLQEVPDAARALAELRRVLKPDGIVSITAEFLDPDYWFLGETIRRLEAAGFTLVDHFGNLWRYTTNFRKVEGNAIGSSYYVARQERLLRQFDNVARRVRPILEAHYEQAFVEIVTADARLEYARLIPQLPYIGGRGNRHTWNLVGSAWFLALYRAMRAHGRAIDEIGQLFTDMYSAWFDTYPSWLLRLQGWYMFTPLARWQLNRQARLSQQRRYSGDWVFTTLPPHNGYDFGVDHTECGILKFLQARGTTELMPYLCPLDFVLSERMNLGLVRTTTLAEGAECCDFRFKHGGETRWSAARPKEVTYASSETS